MDKIKVRVNAKINLTLDVTGDYGNGYHKLDMVMASVGIFDIVEVCVSDKLEVYMDMHESDSNNTAYKVADICAKEFNMPPVRIDITKGIPFGGGLGGSSADAAGVLYCFKQLFGLSDIDAEKIGARVGSDVNFMLKGGFCRAGGKGDDLEILPYKEYALVVAKGKSSAGTKDVFNLFDEIGKSTDYTDKFIRNIDSGEELQYIGNGLQSVTINLCSDMINVIKFLSKYSNYVCMSGSGSCIFAVFEDMQTANAVAEKFKNKFAYIKACTTLPYGIKEF